MSNTTSVAPVATPTRTPVTFLSIQDMKALLKVPVIHVVRNPKTGKLFCSAGNTILKCQQDIDQSAPMNFLIPSDGDEQVLAEACLINSANNTEFSI
jgi:hypothetical protein